MSPRALQELYRGLGQYPFEAQLHAVLAYGPGRLRWGNGDLIKKRGVDMALMPVHQGDRVAVQKTRAFQVVGQGQGGAQAAEPSAQYDDILLHGALLFYIRFV